MIAIPACVHAAARELQSSAGEPLAAFVYDLEGLADHCRRLRQALPANVEMFYAVKANSQLPILETVGRYLDGFEVASGGELELLGRTSLRLRPVVFGGPGKTDAELRQALRYPVEAIHVESLYELERLEVLAEQAQSGVDVLLRVNPDVPHHEDNPMLMAGRPSPFGIQPDDLPVALTRLRRSRRLHCRGFHLHTRSLQLCPHNHLGLLEHYFEICRHWAWQFDLNLREINVGGGIGVNYREPERQFPWESFCAGLRGAIQRHGLEQCLIRFECGRFVSGFCGYYLVEVLDIKDNHGETFVICRGGTHHFRLPPAQGHSHPFAVLPGERPPALAISSPQVRRSRVNVVGQLCTPKDRLATQAEVEHLKVGDVLVFPLAGAYAWNISHHDFLMHPHPRQVFLRAPVLA